MIKIKNIRYELTVIVLIFIIIGSSVGCWFGSINYHTKDDIEKINFFNTITSIDIKLYAPENYSGDVNMTIKYYSQNIDYITMMSLYPLWIENITINFDVSNYDDSLFKFVVFAEYHNYKNDTNTILMYVYDDFLSNNLFVEFNKIDIVNQLMIFFVDYRYGTNPIIDITGGS